MLVTEKYTIKKVVRKSNTLRKLRKIQTKSRFLFTSKIQENHDKTQTYISFLYSEHRHI